jgi:hypothetical protein
MQILVNVSQYVVLLLRVQNDGTHGSNRAASNLLPHAIVAALFLLSRAVDGGLLVSIMVVLNLGLCQQQLDGGFMNRLVCGYFEIRAVDE